MFDRRHRNSSVVVVAVCLVGAHAAHAALTAEQQCQKGRYEAAAKYAHCEQKAAGLIASGGDAGALKSQEAFSKCGLTYAKTWTKLQAKATGSGSTCDNPRYDSSVAGTVTDRLTGLQWEQKTDDDTIHDRDNFFTWKALLVGTGTEADGTAFTDFLERLNARPCFAGECDWRLPTRAELQTILLERYPCTTAPCVDQAIFGPTAGPPAYWSSTTSAVFPYNAWQVNFFAGFVDGSDNGYKRGFAYVRAVRGGL